MIEYDNITLKGAVVDMNDIQRQLNEVTDQKVELQKRFDHLRYNVVPTRMEEQGVWVMCHRGSAAAEDKLRYMNMRAESFGELSVRMSGAERFANEPFYIPNDRELEEELKAQLKMFKSDPFRFGLIPKTKAVGDTKTTIKTILGRSPDKGDALSYLYCAVREMAREQHDSTIPGFICSAPGEDMTITEAEKANAGQYIEGLVDFYGGDRDPLEDFENE